MFRGMEEFEDSRFDNASDIKGAIFGVLDNELEVFDPLTDGEVEESEGLAYLRENVEKFFKANKDFSEIEDIERPLMDGLREKKKSVPNNYYTRKGYSDGITLMEGIFYEMKDQRYNLKFEEECYSDFNSYNN